MVENGNVNQEIFIPCEGNKLRNGHNYNNNYYLGVEIDINLVLDVTNLINKINGLSGSVFVYGDFLIDSPKRKYTSK